MARRVRYALGGRGDRGRGRGGGHGGEPARSPRGPWGDRPGRDPRRPATRRPGPVAALLSSSTSTAALGRIAAGARGCGRVFDRGCAGRAERHGHLDRARLRRAPRSGTTRVDSRAMWVETESLSFTARHEEADEDSAQRTLDALEDLRLKLEDRFDDAPGRRHGRRPPHARLAERRASLPARGAPRRRSGRPPLPGRLGDGARASRAERRLPRQARRRRGLARRVARHRRAPIRADRDRRQQLQPAAPVGRAGASPATCAGRGWSRAARSTSRARSPCFARPSRRGCAQASRPPSRPRDATRSSWAARSSTCLERAAAATPAGS